jgi:uncharacterized protein
MKLDGTLAVITGASSGIGEATARTLATRGSKVILLARSKAKLDQITAEIRNQGGKADCYEVDLRDSHATTTCALKILEDHGQPDILVNNAGAGRWLPINETSREDAAQMMALPYLAAFNLTRELLGGMRRLGKGHIVNLTSVASRLAWPGSVAYIAARRAMEGFDAALRADLYGSGIGVTLAVFGTVESAYWENNPGSREHLPKEAACIRALTADEAGRAIVAAIERNQRIIIKPAIFRLLFLLSELFPLQTEAMMCGHLKKRRMTEADSRPGDGALHNDDRKLDFKSL